jgi:hypothetical protein
VKAGQSPNRHGLARHPLYKVWRAILDRCENPAHSAYRRYGGRGITVYGPWHDVARFIADVEAEIGPRPEGRVPGGRMPLWTFNRKDNNRGYEPGNIEWATWETQNRNREPYRWTDEAIAARATDLLPVGERFVRGVVLDPDAGRNPRGSRLVRLRCEPAWGGCGTIYEATAGDLRAGNTQSCGCLRAEHAARNGRLYGGRPRRAAK